MPEPDELSETQQPAFGGDAAAGEAPTWFGRFRVERRLGAGTFGEVFLGHDVTLDRKVAIKAPRGERSEDAIQRFLAEARSLAQLQHPGVVAVYDVGRDGHRCFIVTEYLPGELLRERIKRGHLDWQSSVRVIAHLADALGHAHSRGIMHRDVKPSNIIVTPEGRCVLIDFGLAVNDLQANRGEVAGTPSYMAPEQVRGESHRVDGRTDIYALAVVLYELLTGRKPFRAETVQELFSKILNDPPQPIRQLNPRVPAAIEEACMRALEKDLNRRFTTAGDFADALLAAAGPVATAGLAGAAGIAAASHEISATSETLTLAATPSADESPSRSGPATRSSSQLRRLREAELRQITLLGVSFDVSQRYPDVEAQHACAERFARLVEAIADQYGARLSSTSGNELEVCFGFPVSYEDSASRAIRSGLEVLARSHADPELPRCEEIYVAVHAGQAIAEESSQGVKVTGDVSQTLRRLLSLLDAGSVVVTESVHQLSRLYFEQENLGETKARGLAKPVTLYRVVREAPVTMNRVELVDPGNLTPLIGRDTELAILRDRWEQAIEGMGQIVLLIGEAGLGKSRLIREIREHVAADGGDPDIVELRCSQHHQSAGLYPLIEHLTQLLKLDDCPTDEARVTSIERYLDKLRLRTDQNVALLASLLGVAPQFAPRLELPPQRTREHLCQLAIDILRQRSEQRPMLFIVEDLHWVDPTLLELLADYVAAFDQHRALSIFTFRPEFETPWRSKPHQTQIALNRLTKRQVREMMRKRLGRSDFSDRIVDQIVERTDGIPLFIEEFSTVVADIDALEGGSISDERLSQIIPTSLQDLLMARLDRLSSDWEVVQMASAIGREFTYELLAATSEATAAQLQEELGKLVDAEILFQKGKLPEASYIFKHALIQDSAYNSLLKKRRQQMHARIATALEGRFPEIAHRQPDLLAHHFTEAAQATQGVEYWLKAGIKAQTVSANVEAISHLRRGLELVRTLEPSPERDRVELSFQLTLGPILMATRGWSAPEVGEAIERARQLCDGVGSVEDQFFVMWGQWGWRLIRADVDICEGIAHDALRLVENSPGARALLSEALWTVGATAYYKGDFVRARELLARALELIDPERERLYAFKTGQFCSVLCRSHVALALWQLGFPDQALQQADETIRLAKPLNHPFSFAMAIFFRRQILQYLGRHEQAAASIAEEYKLCREQGFAFFEAHAIFGRGELSLRQGAVAEARELFETGWRMREAMGGNNSMDHPYRNIAEGFLAAGLRDDARLWLNRGFDLVENHHERGMEAEFLRLRGDLLLAQGDESAAEANYQQALNVARRQAACSWELRTAIRLAELRRRQNRAAEGRDLLESAYGKIREGWDSADLTRARTLLAELGAGP